MTNEQNAIDLVGEFHEAYNAPVYAKPVLPSYQNAYEEIEDLMEKLSNRFKDSNCTSRSFLRMKLIFEEFKELCEAIRDGCFVDILDGLTDLRYVVYGTFHEFGLAPVSHAAFLEVHNSNMSKLGEDGKPILREDGKVLKGPNFFKPDLTKILTQADK